MKTTVVEAREPVGKYAVMRRTPGMKSARFVVLHDDRESAHGEAVRLLAQEAMEHPDWDVAFYVVEIDSMYAAGPSGLHQSSR